MLLQGLPPALGIVSQALVVLVLKPCRKSWRSKASAMKVPKAPHAHPLHRWALLRDFSSDLLRD